MAACSPTTASDHGELRPTPVDSKTAKKAIAKVARALRTLLTDSDTKARIEGLVKQGLLPEDANTKDVVKELKERIGKSPSLFHVLLREIRNFPGGGEVAGSLLQSKIHRYDFLEL